MANGGDGEAEENRRHDLPERGGEQRFIRASGATLVTSVAMGEAMTPEKAYEMGYRHINDLAEMNKIAEMMRIERLNSIALQLMEAWREGAMAAKAMLEKQSSTLQ
ncbi:MAG: hypothetical protein MUE49_12985 [Rhodospirillales bacterium]|jgi:hypothetical protein|nr:hypothetical protein [Rhodospirillales bacterium]